MRPNLVFVAACLGLMASPTLAQGVPPNPFASNLPSRPPQAIERIGRAHAPGTGRRLPPGRVGRGLLPPADVPGR